MQILSTSTSEVVDWCITLIAFSAHNFEENVTNPQPLDDCPLLSLKIKHSSITPKRENIARRFSSFMCFDSIPTKIFLSAIIFKFVNSHVIHVN